MRLSLVVASTIVLAFFALVIFVLSLLRPVAPVETSRPRVAVPIPAGTPATAVRAPVTIVEYSDFECGACARQAETLERLRKRFGEQLRVVWKDAPLTVHPHAVAAAQAARVAASQGHFWPMHDQIFGGGGLERADLEKYARQANVDPARVDAALDERRYVDAIAKERREAAHLGVRVTPTLFVNGMRFDGAQPYALLASVIERELASPTPPAAPKAAPRHVLARR